MALALLCPGQGAQQVGMGQDFVAKSAVAAAVFAEAEAQTGLPLQQLCFTGPQEQLNATNIAQVAIFTTSVAIYRALEQAGKLPGLPALAAGLSLGEYTALHLAGAMSFADALKVVQARGQLMQAAATAAPSTMVAVMGADEPAIAQLCADAASAGIIVAANFNAPGQVVLSGAIPACELAAKLCEERGFRATMLSVAGAFHSPFMQSAADQMATVLAGVTISTPRIPVISNVTAQPHTTPDSIRSLLVQQVVGAVKWYQSIDTLKTLAADTYLEIGPGRVLTGLMKRIDRKAAITNLSTAECLA